MNKTLSTAIEVTHLDLDKLITGGSKQGIVKMVIGSRNLVITMGEDGNEYASVEVAYTYLDDQNRILPTEDGGIFRVNDTPENPNYIRNLSQQLSGMFAAGTNLLDMYDANVLTMAKLKFAERYGVLFNQIVENQL